MVCKQYIILNHVLSEKIASFPKPFPARFPTTFPAAFPTTFPTEFCQGLTKSVKFQRKDQSVKRNAHFYYFGQFRVFPLYF